jgi:DNA repair protein RadC
MAQAPNDAAGHRARLRTRLIETGGVSLADYELIEYLLALAIPRRDTKPLAKALLREFGSIGGIMAAEPAALLRISGIGETAVAALKIVQASALRMLKTQMSALPLLASWQSVIDYLHADMAYLGIERVRIIYLNAKNFLIRDEIMSEGSIDETAFYVREVLRRAIELGAAAIIVVHNHPTGDPKPSHADIAITRELIEGGRRLKIAVHDHIIIGTQGYTSLRTLGLM